MLKCFAAQCVVPLSLCLFLAGVFPLQAWAIADDEINIASEEEIATAFANGEIKTEIPDQTGGLSRIYADESYKPITTLAGITQYDTAAIEAKYIYPTSPYAIIASGVSAIDALSAAPLAGALDCPILLTERDVLPESTREALSALNVKAVIIVGGSAVVSEKVAAQLAAYGSVDRLYGETQYDTQEMVYRYGLKHLFWSNPDQVIIASGCDNRFADALSISPLAFKYKIPIILVDEKGNVPAASQKLLRDTATLRKVILVGGTVVVSDSTEKYMKTLTTEQSGTANVVRLGGVTLYDTSAMVAQWATSKGFLNWDKAAFATGKLPFDALAGSAVQGTEGAVLLLMDNTDTTTLFAMSSSGATVNEFKFFGGSALFSQGFKTSCALKMGFKLKDVEGFVLYLDVGHGYNSSNNGLFDSGAQGYGGREYDLNYELAHKVAKILRGKYGMEVYVNDDGGYYAYRQAEALALGCGAFVSIHFNAGGGTGTESYIHSYNAAIGSKVLQSHIHPALVKGTSLPDRGQKIAEFAVCNGQVPAVLLEVAFIDREQDMRIYQERKDYVAEQIAIGIMMG